MALDLKKLNEIPWYLQLGIFLLLGGMVAGGGYWWFISGLQEQITIKQKTLDGLKVDIQRGQAVEQKHLEFQNQNKRLRDKLSTLKIILPEAKQTDDLLRQIQSSALSSGLTIKLFQPQAIIQKDFFSEWPISMDVEGNYHNLGVFFDRLSKLSRIVNVSNVRIIQSNVRDNPARSIRATYTATTFVYNEVAPESSATSGKDKKGAAKAQK
jgi:type IV pilus assembly protein PilO